MFVVNIVCDGPPGPEPVRLVVPESAPNMDEMLRSFATNAALRGSADASSAVTAQAPCLTPPIFRYQRAFYGAVVSICLSHKPSHGLGRNLERAQTVRVVVQVGNKDELVGCGFQQYAL